MGYKALVEFLDRRFTLLLLLVCTIHLGALIYAYPIMSMAPMTGDEPYEWQVYGSSSIIWNELFLPGIGILLKLFHPIVDASVPKGRLVVACIGLVSLIWSLALLRRASGAPVALTVAVGTLLFLDFHTMNFTFWGEHLSSILLIAQFSLILILVRGEAPPVKTALYVGLSLVTLIFLLYLRQNSVLIVAIVAVACLLIAIQEFLTFRSIRPILITLPILYLACLSSLIPWWNYLSQEVGALRMKATSVDISLAVHYGYDQLSTINPDLYRFIEEQEKDPNRLRNRFNFLNRSLNLYERQHGVSRSQLVGDLRKAAMQNVTVGSLLHRVPESYGRLLLSGGDFSQRFVPNESAAEKRSLMTATGSVWNFLHSAGYYAFPVLFTLSFIYCIIGVFERGKSKYIHIIYFGFFVFASITPFIHQTNARHYIAFIPTITLGAALLIWRRPFPGSPNNATIRGIEPPS